MSANAFLVLPSWRLTCAFLLAISIAAGLSNQPSSAASRGKNQPETNQPKAEELVREALAHESLGLEKARAELLVKAAVLAPDFAPPRWHQGQIRHRGQWTPIDDYPESDHQRRDRVLYEKRRSQVEDTVAGQLTLANWCRTEEMPDQEIAHLNRVIQLAPNHPDARRRLGHRRVDGRWLDVSDLWQGINNQRQVRASVQTWQGRLMELADQASESNGEKLAAMRAQLMTDLDSDAVPAIEVVLGSHSEAAARLAIGILAEQPTCDSSQSLIRLAVLSPWSTIREAATRELKSRPYDHYVPLLLAEMSTPVESRIETALINGQLFYRHFLEREFQDRRQLSVLDTVQLRRPGSGGPLAEGVTRARAVTDMQRSFLTREMGRQRYNQWVTMVNQRIGQVLAYATGQNLPPSPESWWAWWDKENGVAMIGEKYADVRYNRDVQVYQDIIPTALLASSVSNNSDSAAAPRRVECFVAGTLVWTRTGPVPIESITVGDMVLSQHPETGELAFKAVLQTSVREPEPLVKVVLTSHQRETLEGSGGHPLWVSGEGWTLLRQIASGTILHGVAGASVVSVVEKGRIAETHNLVIHDFHTYVVGQAKILCHDNTSREATDAMVPGLIER